MHVSMCARVVCVHVHICVYLIFTLSISTVYSKSEKFQTPFFHLCLSHCYTWLFLIMQTTNIETIVGITSISHTHIWAVSQLLLSCKHEAKHVQGHSMPISLKTSIRVLMYALL